MTATRTHSLFFAAAVLCSTASAQTYHTPEAAQADPDFALQGEYVRARDNMGAQLVANSEGEFRLLLLTGGLPGEGWNGTQKQELVVDTEEAIDILEGYKKIERQSPTLSKSAPEGATTLFDGTRETVTAHWQQPSAKMTDDGLLLPGAKTSERFQDYTLHIEFRTPYKPQAKGQDRGRSGILQQDRYEVPIVDSFGLPPAENHTGGISGIGAPNLNMCFPPLTWQTYDLDFMAARFEDGQQITPAKLTVKLNGKVVQRDVELTQQPDGSPLPNSSDPGTLLLADYGDPVRYRNIWVQPRNFDALARRPIVLGFERFHGEADLNPVDGGQLLLGELNCLSCHQATKEFATFLAPKKAPRLDNVSERLQPEWMVDFISNPHLTKAGTTMPDVMVGMTDEERREAAISLVSFLVEDQQIAMGGDPGNAGKGKQLFHSVGCVACHQTRDSDVRVSSATSVPLIDLDKKYSAVSLEKFLQNPTSVRPASRMPHIELEKNGGRDLVQFLLKDSANTWTDGPDAGRPKHPNMRYQVFHQHFEKLPDFSKLTPDKTGVVAGFDFSVAERTNSFAIVFEGFLPITKAGEYTFRTKSDDGSALYVDGKRVVTNDGVHPADVREGKLKLKPGVYPLRVEYFEAGGEEVLSVYWARPGDPGTTLDSSVVMTPNDVSTTSDQAQEQETETPNDGIYEYTFDASKVARGRELFATLGCASCHERKDGNTQITSLVKAPALKDCTPDSGCLSQNTSDTKRGVPNFDLSEVQTVAIESALDAGTAIEVTEQQQVVHTMKTFNCYACHQRDGMGGPETDRNSLFTTTIPEMGDEGRLPPLLTGVGDKLKESYLKKVMAKGANDRPYMHTQMPGFGPDATSHLVAAFAKLDLKNEATIPEMPESPNRLAATGRKLAGDKGLSCVKCHTFGKFKASGIQAIGLDIMAERLREDWFHRYLVDPVKYRPGTRMPTAFPNGKSVATDIYDADPQKQLAAIWAYLSKGSAGGVPEGIVGGLIELKPTTRPIIYRNFLEGLSSRGIAVGYPEKAHLAWDADRLSLALLWQGRFMDASLHWQGRGQGRQRPLGDNIIGWEDTVPIAVLETPESPWPTGEPRDLGYRFSGYRLDQQGRPTFRYRTHSFTVDDTPRAIPDKAFPAIVRQLHVKGAGDDTLSPQPNGQLYFRAIRNAKVVRQDDGSWLVGGTTRVRIHTNGPAPIERTSEGMTEVLVPLAAEQQIEQEIVW